jgi:pimeloyl-ACP methyl ester carboxylesterase
VVVCPDGTTSNGQSGFNFLNAAKDLQRLHALHEELKKAFKVNATYLYGHSQGSFFSFLYAGAYPDDVQGLVGQASGVWSGTAASPKQHRQAIVLMHGTAGPGRAVRAERRRPLLLPRGEVPDGAPAQPRGMEPLADAAADGAGTRMVRGHDERRARARRRVARRDRGGGGRRGLDPRRGGSLHGGETRGVDGVRAGCPQGARGEGRTPRSRRSRRRTPTRSRRRSARARATRSRTPRGSATSRTSCATSTACPPATRWRRSGRTGSRSTSPRASRRIKEFYRTSKKDPAKAFPAGVEAIREGFLWHECCDGEFLNTLTGWRADAAKLKLGKADLKAYDDVVPTFTSGRKKGFDEYGQINRGK